MFETRPLRQAQFKPKYDGNVGERPIERFLLGKLEMRHAGCRGERRQADRGQDFIRLQLVLTLEIAIGRREKILKRTSRTVPSASISSTVATVGIDIAKNGASAVQAEADGESYRLEKVGGLVPLAMRFLQSRENLSVTAPATERLPTDGDGSAREVR